MNTNARKKEIISRIWIQTIDRRRLFQEYGYRREIEGDYFKKYEYKREKEGDYYKNMDTDERRRLLQEIWTDERRRLLRNMDTDGRYMEIISRNIE